MVQHLDPDRREFILRMLAGAAWTAPFVASFSLGGLLSESAWAQGGNLCPTSSNLGSAVEVLKTASADEMTAGSNLTYTLTVQNCTFVDTPTVSLVDPLPPGTTFVSATKVSGSNAWTLITPPVGSGGTVQASIPLLHPHESGVFQIVVYVVPGP